jgi:hypothetical protein
MEKLAASLIVPRIGRGNELTHDKDASGARASQVDAATCHTNSTDVYF